MSLSVTIREERYLRIQQLSCILSWSVLVMVMFAGCHTILPSDSTQSELSKQQVFNLEHISSEQSITFLSQLDLDEVSFVPKTGTVLVKGSAEQIRRASLVLDLVDAKEDFAIQNLGPASIVRSLPSNSQIATVLGDITIGTFTDPPRAEKQSRGIIDIQGNTVLAILPARYREQLLDLLKQADSETASIHPMSVPSEHRESHHEKDTSVTYTDSEPDRPKAETSAQQAVSHPT